ncbi:carboxymuconolactone decarboxylase family protein [Dactylosporangium roseum]|uniref:Alkyl hydroperoxide reductase AhpD n=1 Tax=Dactylosporangium roseum TaxID=47989 RepID=A0ABY5Z998_9ACTN|nr:carboxymuconolactone decarboxylase family protein [Dactylosporangium roseum]UWZ38131.1 carboxymuconolactone decarboxylase family protein [Dactylosporangium roseum]
MSISALKAALPPYARDVALNLNSVLSGDRLTEQQLWGTVLAGAMTTRSALVLRAVAAEADDHLKPEAAETAKAVASRMAIHNVYFRAKHLIGDEAYQHLPARLRRQVTATPGVPMVDSELWSVAVSAITGCGVCLESHERSLHGAGVSREVVDEVLRAAAVVHALAVTLDAEAALG